MDRETLDSRCAESKARMVGRRGEDRAVVSTKRADSERPSKFTARPSAPASTH